MPAPRRCARTFRPPNRGELAGLLWRKGRKKEAVAAARFVRQLWPQKPRWFADGYAIWVLQQAGLRDEAAAYAAQLLKDLPETNSHRGLVLAAVGRFGDALPYLERSGLMTQWSLFWAPMWDPFRDDPRFLQLLAKLGCAEEYKIARETLARMLKEQAAGGGGRKTGDGEQAAAPKNDRRETLNAQRLTLNVQWGNRPSLVGRPTIEPSVEC